LTENSDYVCIPMQQISYEDGAADTTNGVVYLVNASAWFGEDATEENITSRVVGDISISHGANKASSTSLNLSCRVDDFENSPVTSPGSVVEISAGYVTGSGNELQKRFTGSMQSYSRSIGSGSTLQAKILDNLHIATTRKQRLPHVLEGQNAFYADFASITDMDLFVQQSGSFYIEAGELIADIPDSHIAIAGYNPDDVAITSCKFKVTGSATDVSVGLMFHGKTYQDKSARYKMASWDINSGKFLYHELVADDVGVLTHVEREWSITSQAVVVDTYYWLMARVKHGQLDVWYSTDGIHWALGLNSVDIAMGADAVSSTVQEYEGYLGIYAWIGDQNRAIKVDEMSIFSMYPPQSGSDVMKYLAAICDMDTDEEMEIDDSFPGSSFDSVWDTPGVDGTWSVSGGSALGYTSATAAMLRCETGVADVIVKANVEPPSNYGVGVFARGSSDLSECYALVLGGIHVYLKKKDTTWSTLMRVPLLYAPPTSADLVLCCRGSYISGFVNGALCVYAHDADFTSGYCGMIAEGTSGDKSEIKEFQIDGFYSPVDVATVRPGDTAVSVMNQIAALYEDGLFFSDKDGKLRWGKFSATSADLDVRGTTIRMDVDNATDRILSFIRIVGNNAYGEVKDRDWGRALLGYEYTSAEDKSTKTGSGCIILAQKILALSKKIITNAITIIGHPGMEIGDVVSVAETPSGSPESRLVLSYNETIGSVYTMDISELRTQAEETP